MSADTSGLNRCGEWVNELISAIQGEQGFPDSSIGKEFACNARDPGSIPGMGRSTGEGIGYPLQYSWASQEYWKSTGEGIGYPLQYSWASLWLSWQRIHLQCRRPGFDPWVGKITWRRERLLTPVVWPGEFHGLYSPWSRKESDTTERLSLTLSHTGEKIGCLGMWSWTLYMPRARRCEGQAFLRK